MNQTKLNQEKYQKDNKSSCLIKAHHSWKKKFDNKLCTVEAFP